jgi:hypothetical protein
MDDASLAELSQLSDDLLGNIFLQAGIEHG